MGIENGAKLGSYTIDREIGRGGMGGAGNNGMKQFHLRSTAQSFPFEKVLTRERQHILNLFRTA